MAEARVLAVAVGTPDEREVGARMAQAGAPGVNSWEAACRCRWTCTDSQKNAHTLSGCELRETAGEGEHPGAQIGIQHNSPRKGSKAPSLEKRLVPGQEAQEMSRDRA